MDTPAASRRFCLFLWALLCLQAPALAGDVARSKFALIGGHQMSSVEVVGSTSHPFEVGNWSRSWDARAGRVQVEPQVAKFPKVPARRVPGPYRANPKSSPREGSTLDDVGHLATLDADGWKVMGVLLLTALVIGGLIWLFRAKKKRRQRAGTVQG
jgi:hypothetical protein